MSAEFGPRAFIFDLLSVSFAYPTEELYLSLLSGRYVKELQAQLSLLSSAEEFAGIIDELSVYHDKQQSSDFNAFQSEYIALFEHNKKPLPLHLNAHLYNAEPQPVPVYLRLRDFYRQFDIEMGSDKVTEQPDHLSVQLEFVAYLYRLLIDESDEFGRQKIKTGLSDFCSELEWTQHWMRELQERPRHAFYHPMALLLLSMIEKSCSES